jgi:hypothetical protein
LGGKNIQFMPNHIRNRLAISGDIGTINALVSQFSTFYPETQHEAYDGSKTYEKVGEKHAFGWLQSDGTFTVRDKDGKNVTHPTILEGYAPHMNAEWTQFPDFNKVFPRPEDLNITSDGLVMFIENQFSRHRTMGDFIAAIEKSQLESVENLAKAIVNLKKYGFATWYEWSVSNWGTKWNSYSCVKIGENVWQFDTAWCGVLRIVEAISKAFPDLEITYETSDEDCSSQCAIYNFKDGLKSETKYESGSKEAYEHYFKLHGNAYRWEFVDGEYRYKDEEPETAEA